MAGLGLTPMTTKTGPDVTTLAVTALTEGVRDADLSLQDIDGLLINRSGVPGAGTLSLDLARTAGLQDLRVLKEVECRGTTAALILAEAFTMVESGAATTIAAVFADTPIGSTGSAGAGFAQYAGSGHTRAVERAAGLLGAVPAYALIAARYAAVHGLEPEDLATVALTARQWAAGNPLAVSREPLAMASYVDSPMVATPLRRLDCARPVNGAAALLVTAGNSGHHPIVRVVGAGAAHPVRRRVGPGESWFDVEEVPAANVALAEAGISREDVDVLQLYDAFTIVTLCLLEAHGFAPPGGGAAWMHDGHGSPGGSLPLNTGGGHLSGWYLQGMTPVVEAIIQLRGSGGARQVPEAQTAFVATMGGRLDDHAVLVLRRED